MLDHSHILTTAPHAPPIASLETIMLGQASAPPPTSGDAQPATPGQGAPAGSQGQPAAPPPGLGNGFFLILLLLMAALFLPTIFAGRKEKKRRARMLASLAKHDRVQTIGGILGTVVEVRETEVALKVDDATNTRIRFARSAVQQVLRKSGERSDHDLDDAQESAPTEPALHAAVSR